LALFIATANVPWKCTKAKAFRMLTIHRPLLSAALLFTTSVALAAEPAPSPQLRELQLVTTADGKQFEAEFAGVSSDGQIVFTQDGKQRKIAAEDLVQWGAGRALPVAPHLYLADGSVIAASATRSDKDSLYAEPQTFNEVKAPLDQVRAAILQPPNTPAARRKMLAGIAAATGVQDRIILANGDETNGTLLKIGGMVEDVVAGQVEFRSRGSDRNLLTKNITAIVMNPVLLKKTAIAGLHTWMVFRDGSRLLTSKVVHDESGLVTITLACGVELVVNQYDFVDQIQMLQPVGGRAKFLSDFKPVAYRHTPFLKIPWPMHLNANAENGPLATAAGVYLHGIGMHSRSRVAFPLGGRYKRFLASLAVDAIAGRRGSVTFRVYLSRDGGWKPVYESAIIRGGQPPTPVNLDIEKAAAMLLIVDFADRGDELDFANWLNACVVAD